MFKGLFLIGSHLRHEFVVESCKHLFDKTLIIKYQREDIIPQPPTTLTKRYSELYSKHFSIRHEVENSMFGGKNATRPNAHSDNIDIQSTTELHSEYICGVVHEFNADFCLVFGTHILRKPIIDVLPEYCMNLHLGLSPWYRGDATLFWPFYMLQPQECGITFHKLAETADSGDIFHQARPNLELGDRLHDVGVKCVLLAATELKKLINKTKTEGLLESVRQSSRGKEWLATDFKPEHLAFNYEVFKDDIVDWHFAQSNTKKRSIIEQDFKKCTVP